jgi:sec-independent protein translocase protein TatB
MFDVGMSELVLISIIGLLVLGPQRLPKVAAEIGKWIGRARRTATQLRRQLEREIELSELETPPQRPAPPAPQPPPVAEAPPSAGQAAPPPATHTSPTAAPPPSATEHSTGSDAPDVDAGQKTAATSRGARERLETTDESSN